LLKGNSIKAQPELFRLDHSFLDGPDVLAGPDIGPTAEEVLFPTSNNLTANQINDIEHLRLHVMTGCDVFVTLNTRDFINGGKQVELASYGIWVFTPEGIVSLLKNLYCWN